MSQYNFISFLEKLNEYRNDYLHITHSSVEEWWWAAPPIWSTSNMKTNPTTSAAPIHECISIPWLCSWGPATAASNSPALAASALWWWWDSGGEKRPKYNFLQSIHKSQLGKKQTQCDFFQSIHESQIYHKSSRNIWIKIKYNCSYFFLYLDGNKTYSDKNIFRILQHCNMTFFSEENENSYCIVL